VDSRPHEVGTITYVLLHSLIKIYTQRWKLLK
jgi:hypothetical protein